jgi:5-methylcytosine-specific restriction endonuclease McrA
MEFSLTETEYLEKTKECHYCGDDLNKIHEGVKLDRVDSSKFYTLQNTVGCCRMCNVAKNNHSIEVFLDWIKRLKVRN